MSWTKPQEAARFQAALEQKAREQLAERLVGGRNYKGWTVEELAHHSGVSGRNINRLEKALTENPRDGTIKKLAVALKIPFNELRPPRITPEAADKAAQTQLDQIEAMLRVLIAQIPDSKAALERELLLARERDAARARGSAAQPHTPRRKRKAQ